MAGGFGFSRFPQQPAPSAEEVGLGLLQQGQTAQAPGPASFAAPAAPADPIADDRRLREEGAQRMGAPGQIPDSGDEDGMHSANAVSIAVGEALTRQGGGYVTNANPFKDRPGHVRQLMQLGLSDIEAQLLVRSGGV